MGYPFKKIITFDRDLIVQSFSLIEPIFTSIPVDIPAFAATLFPLTDQILLHEQFNRATHFAITYTIFDGTPNGIRYVSILAPETPLFSADDSGFYASDSETVWIVGQKQAKHYRHFNASGALARYRVAMFGVL